ncbi:unnamed protein product [Hymenolepis diminuta]|uniref:Peptidase M1 leukotriene A4 hydrolase/aminopeptidase C-terminal domain-containing protein n=1 Tax=Hymenolepis diminuta TaxID=6216 RepID=A0A564ZBA3_HYMDI|nr:unnamed protein product [Hymenolepis diminuta]
MAFSHSSEVAIVSNAAIHDPSSEANPNLHVIQHVDFDLKIDFDTKTVSGNVKIMIEQIDTSTEKQEPLKLDIKDINVSRVTLNDAPVDFEIHPGSYPALGSVLCIKVGKQASKFAVVIEYSTTPQASALQWLEAQMTADKRSPFLFTQCQAIHARSLFPCQDTPKVKFTYTAKILAPANLQVLMSATKSNSTSSEVQENWGAHYFFQNVRVPSYLIALACGELNDSPIGLNSRVYAEPSVLPRAAREFNVVDRMLDAAVKICGPYSWGCYDILVLPPSFPYGGMENPQLTFVTPTILAGDGSLLSTIAHEIAHSWTGNLVTNATWEHFWLNEGHTVYVEGLILEELYGTDHRELFIELGYEVLQACLQNEFKANHPFAKLIPCLKGIHTDDSFSIVPYQKGSLFLYYLEKTYGKEAILKWLRAYIDNYREKSITTDEWKQFLSLHLGKQVLDEVDWDTWLFSAGPIPWVPPTNRVLSNVVDEITEKIRSTSLINDTECAAYLRSKYESMIPLQRQLLWQQLLKYVPLPHDNLNVLNTMLALSQTQNTEIRFRWSQIVIDSQYLPGLDGALEFLNSQGRLKFTRPLYRALMGWPSIRAQAINNFKANRPYMHPTTAKLVEKDIESAQSQ